jgi:hypothetical protein
MRVFSLGVLSILTVLIRWRVAVLRWATSSGLRWSVLGREDSGTLR